MHGTNSVDADRTLTQRLDDIIESELDNQPTATDEHYACRGGSTVLNNLPVRLLEKVKACGDRMICSRITGTGRSNLATANTGAHYGSLIWQDTGSSSEDEGNTTGEG